MSEETQKTAAKEAKKETMKKGDFIEIEYIGALGDGQIFDTTDEGVAKKNKLYSKGVEYGPVVICIGQRNIVKGIDDQLEGKETRTEYDLKISPENGFGKKDAKLIQLISTNKFLKQNINPMPGLQVNIDNTLGTVKSVSGGRTLVDFNHPLSGQELAYKIRVKGIVRDDREKLVSVINHYLHVPKKELDITIEGRKASIKTKEKLGLPESFAEQFSKKVNELISSIEKVEFS